MTSIGRFGRVGTVGGAVSVAVVAILASCGGGGSGNGNPASAATIDMAGVTGAVADISAFMPLCNPAAGTSTGASGVPGLGAKVIHSLNLRRQSNAFAGTPKRAMALTSTRPADQLGSCGGRYGYPDYSHLNGVTTATLTFTDYCTTDSATGGKQTVNGSISFVNTATPTASGPITTRLEANSPAGVSVAAKDSAGRVIGSQTLSFTGFVMSIGVPGGTPTAASPDRLELADMKVTNSVTGKTYRQTGWSMTDFSTASGGEQVSLTGRGYRSSGDYYDISTTTPVVFDASGDTVSGALTFTGANGNTAVARLVPGSTLQATLIVNGTPVPSLPACAK